MSIVALLRLPDYRRVWLLGGIANAMRWLEILAGTLWVFEQTGSALAVSAVVMMRALPMLLLGAMAGALAERFDRRLVLAGLQATSAVSAGLVVLLAVTGLLQPWHLMAQGLIAGLSWSGEMATRRRMAADLAPPGEIVRAIAFDTLTGSCTRALGPLLGGALFQWTGLAFAVAIACFFHLVALGLVLRIRPPPRPEGPLPPLSFAGIAEAAAFARREPRLRLVLAMTLVMNIFAFAYGAVLPAFGAVAFGVSGAAIGLLAAAEPFGALLGGLWLTLRPGRPPGPASFVLGSASFWSCCCWWRRCRPIGWRWGCCRWAAWAPRASRRCKPPSPWRRRHLPCAPACWAWSPPASAAAQQECWPWARWPMGWGQGWAWW